MLHLIVVNILCIGYIALMFFVYRVFKLIRQFLRHAKDLKDFGEWCVVTGGTDGIGKAICFELASKGQNILIVGRNEMKLNNVINEISDIYPNIILQKCQIDLSKFDENAQNKYKQAIKNKNIGVLINNAGLSYNFVTYMDEVDKDRIENIMKVNNHASTLIMYLTLKELLKMKEKDESKLSAIVNISSTHSVIPCELHSVYSASKSYLNKLTLDLGYEYSDKGIVFQVQLPHFVCSKMSKIRNPSLTTPTTKTFAKYSVSQIGYTGLIYPYPIHAIMFFIVSLIPTKLLRIYVKRFHTKIMNLGKKKMQLKRLQKLKVQQNKLNQNINIISNCNNTTSNTTSNTTPLIKKMID